LFFVFVTRRCYHGIREAKIALWYYASGLRS
jgi:hypothetical protein